jgi:hypothetical protein
MRFDILGNFNKWARATLKLSLPPCPKLASRLIYADTFVEIFHKFGHKFDFVNKPLDLFF